MKFGIYQIKTNVYLFGVIQFSNKDNMKSKTLIAIGILVLFLIIVVNESRFILWGPFGVPEKPTSMNCGEDRFKFNYVIKSKQDFLNVIDSLKKIDSGQEGFKIAQWVKNTNFTVNDVSERWSGSLLFSQKLYSVPSCGGRMVFEMGENGYASARGCCGK